MQTITRKKPVRNRAQDATELLNCLLFILENGSEEDGRAVKMVLDAYCRKLGGSSFQESPEQVLDQIKVRIGLFYDSLQKLM